MESVIIKPERELKTVMFIIWAFVLIIILVTCIPFIIFIPDTEAKVVFGILLTVSLLIMVLYALWIPAYYKTLVYNINSEAVKMNRGVFWKRFVTVPYNKITNVDMSQGPLERKYKLGTIHVQTAGAGGAQGAQAELKMAGVRNLEELKNIIMQGVRDHESRPHEKKTVEIGETELLSSMLKELRAIRASLER